MGDGGGEHGVRMHCVQTQISRKKEKNKEKKTYLGVDDGRVRACVRSDVLCADAN